MPVGDIAVTVTPDAREFWTRFRAQTSGQAENEGRRAGDEFRRGLEGANARPIQIRAELDAARLRAQIAELSRSQAIRLRADVDTARARTELASLQRQGQQSGGGLLKALLPLAPALAPLAGAALAAGSGLAVLGGAGLLAVTGFKREMAGATGTGQRAAAVVGALRTQLHSLQSTASRAALPGLEASVVSIRRELPALRSAIGEQAAVAGDVVSHLTHGIVAGFTTFRPIISAVGSDVDSLAKHFDTFASGPGGARFAKTLATDYAEVKPVIESVVRAVADIARAGGQSGLGILHILGTLSDIIDSFPTPVLTAIVDGFLAFRAVGVASVAIASVQRAFAGVKAAAAGVAAATQLAATQRAAAEAAAAAATTAAEATAAEAMLATAQAAREELLAVSTTRGQLSGSQEAQLAVQLGIADREIASYEAVALAARASAAEQAAAAEAASAAAAATRSTAGAGSLLGKFGKVLGPLALVATALPLLSSAFGDNGQAAEEAAAAVDGYASALVASQGAITGTIRAQVAKNLADNHSFDLLTKYGVTTNQVTDAIIEGGSALKAVTAIVDQHAKAQGASAATIIGLNAALSTQSQEYAKGAVSANQQLTATRKVTAAEYARAASLHTTIGAYQAANTATAGNLQKTREQTVAFQLENDAASLLSNALKSLAGQNLDVAQSQTAFEQAIHTASDALKNNHDAILGNSNAALANQQAIQGTVSAARQYADAIAKQTGSSDKAAGAYRRSRDAVLAQLKAQGQLTPEVRKYINSLFDVKGVADYLARHPTKLDAETAAGRAKIKDLQDRIDAIRQGRVPGIAARTEAARIAILDLQHQIDVLHGKNVYIHAITTTSHGSQSDTPVAQASGGYIRGPGSGTSDSIPAWLSNGEYVVNARATAKHRHLLEQINKGVRGFASGGPVSGGTYTYNGIQYSSQRAMENAEAHAAQVSAKARTQATNSLPPDVHAIIGALSGSVAAVRKALDAFVKDFKTAGASVRQLARASADEQRLLANQQKLVAARGLLQRVTDYSGTVRGALTGGFDPTKSGSVADLISGYKAQTGQNDAFTSEVNKLRREAKGDKAELGLINTLAASGQSASLQSLAAGSPRDLANAGKAYSGYNQSVQGGVNAADVARFGKTQAQASADVDRLVRRQDRLIEVLAKLGAAVAGSHGKSGEHVEQQLDRFANELATLVQHGRR